MTQQPPVAPDYDARTVAVRAGRVHNDTALAPLLWASSAFVADGFDHARLLAGDNTDPRFYGRNSNPTVADFEHAMAELEGAEASRAFASGMGAMSAVVLALCSSGDHIVAQSQIYSHTQMLLQAVCPRFGIDVSFVDGTVAGAFEAAVVPGRTTLVLAESPANPKLALVDLELLGAVKGPVTVVDSTFATPIAQRPLEYGVDLVVHSATKAIAGHNDAILGVVSGSEEVDRLDPGLRHPGRRNCVAFRRTQRSAGNPDAAHTCSTADRDGDSVGDDAGVASGGESSVLPGPGIAPSI